MLAKFDGEHWWIKTTGLIVKSKNKDLLFDGLMYAMIDLGIKKDSFNPVTVTIVESTTIESKDDEKKLSNDSANDLPSGRSDSHSVKPVAINRRARRNTAAPPAIASIALAAMKSGISASK